MQIKILGTGCANCKKLETTAKEAVSELGIDASIEKVEDIKDIMSYGVLSTPGLVVDGVVKISGRVPSVADVKALLKG
ncbi:MAG TPA: thioredoxin family protein [Candidatus Aquicultor sp.]|jgi:small redox-active disulfide protein 2